ncbi:hypothetical protein RhiJN_15257 [Ceratobasidium sp. AG-Ba]|nr:hypothetical protein RhiJN_15257 [Ceratobasidium sp. AG-Ba]
MRRNNNSAALGSSGAQYMRSNTRSSSYTAHAPPVQPPAELPLHEKCLQVLELLDSLSLSFGELIVAVCYGEELLRRPDLAQKARKSLYRTDSLKRLLELSFSPPKPPSGGGPTPVAGSTVIRRFACVLVRGLFASELGAFSEDYKLSKKQLADSDYISTITSTSLHNKIKSDCPELYATISALTNERPEEEEWLETEEDAEYAETEVGPRLPRKKHPQFDIVFQITSMAFRLNHHRNTLQKILTNYMHAKHTNKDVINILQQAGIAMSYSWIRRALSNLSVDLRHQMILAAHTENILCTHDNLKLDYKVGSQRGDHQSVSEVGTASTMIILRGGSAAAFSNPDDFMPLRRSLKAQRAAGTAPRLCWNDLRNPAWMKYNLTSSTHDVLDMLRLIPGLAGSKLWKSQMLPTTNIDETSYSGASQMVPFVLHALELDKEPQRDRLVLERLIPWPGDQVTAQRSREVQNFRQESINGFHRWEPFLFYYAGFHALMALAQAIINLYRGSTVGPTCDNDIIALERRGLQKVAGGKRLDFHTMEEFLLHECEAHFRVLFEELTGCKTEEEVGKWAQEHTPDELFELAKNMLIEYSSSGALDTDESKDQLKLLMIQRRRDLMLYYSSKRAYKHGDVDRIEALLPEHLFFFIGAGNGNYAKEVFNFLQVLTHECTPDVRTAILQHGLVVNKLGRADSFYPIDQQQEFNNAAIKNYGPPPQNASWEQYGRNSIIIPVLADVVKHVEDNITGISRSHIHKDPKHEADIQTLARTHRKFSTHKVEPGRAIKNKDKAKDARKLGIIAIRNDGTLEKYHTKRNAYNRFTSSRQYSDDYITPPPSPRVQSPVSSPPLVPAPQDTGLAPTQTAPSLSNDLAHSNEAEPGEGA